MHEIKEYLDTGITPQLAESIAVLCCRCFLDSKRTVEERVKEMLEAIGSAAPEHVTGRRFVIWQGEQVIAHARTFVREIIVEDQRLPVLALAAVCSDPEIRGKGLGVRVTQKAFQQVATDAWPEVSLFQTPVPGFYQKLNSRLVTNRFVNRCNVDDPEANPWRDDQIMIYPSEFAWPEGTVDLNGCDY